MARKDSPPSLDPAGTAGSLVGGGLFPFGWTLVPPSTGHEREADPLRSAWPLAGEPAGEVAGDPGDLRGVISSWVLKSTAPGLAESSPLHSLSRSGMLKARSSWSLDRDTGEGWAWRTEDLFLLMGEAGLPVVAGVPTGTGDFFGSGPGPLWLVSGGVCLETVSVMLDGDFVIGGRRLPASLWFSLQELKLRRRDLAVTSAGLPAAMLPDDRLLTGGLELTDRNGDGAGLAAGRSELARFSKDLILCLTEKNEVDSWGQFCSQQ